MSNEITIAQRWLWETLSADLTLISLVANRIYTGAGPQGVVYPYVFIQPYKADPDSLSMGGFRHRSYLEYIVQGVNNTSDEGELEPIADAIDVVLHARGNEPVTGGGMVLICYRVAPFAFSQDLDTVQYRRLGGRYRLEIVPG